MSKMWEYVKIALMNIKSNKGRSVLTMLGIIIGISSVIMIISIGNGVKGQINGELNAMAGGQLYLQVNSDGDGKGLITLTDDDFDAIKEKVDHVKGVTPNYNIYCTLNGRKGNFEAIASGGNASLEFSSSDEIIKGHYFTDEDYFAARKVCVITESTARELFGTTNVVGMSLEMSLWGITHELKIVGIRADNASQMLGGMMSGGMLTLEMPFTTLENSFGFYMGGFDGCYIIADSAAYTTQVAADSIRLLEGRHNVRGQNIFTMQSFADIMSQTDSVLNMMTTFIVFVAAISLLVGGIGVMNIMLVSVTERTREIGIRKALGARTHSILTQFLSESAIITLLGGLIGIILGVLGAVLVCSVLGFQAQVNATTIIGATVFSSAVGIFFGIYPARKAARLSPIEALRHE